MEHEKYMTLAKLNEGDKVKLTSGEEAEFVRLKRKKFIGVMNGTNYDIPVSLFKEVVDQVDVEKIRKQQEDEVSSLKKQELFFIKLNGDAILFKFDSIKNDKIVGISVATNGITNIDKSLYGGKVANL